MTDATAAKLVTKGDPRVTRVGRFIRKTSHRRAAAALQRRVQGQPVAGRPAPARGARQGATTGSTTRRSTAISPATASSPASPAGRRSTAGAARPTPHEKIQRRVEHDLYYIENWSVLFDLYILVMTPLALAQDRERLLMIARSRATPTARAARAALAICSVERLRGALLWLTGVCGAIVFIEPSPYEVVVAADHRRVRR